MAVFYEETTGDETGRFHLLQVLGVAKTFALKHSHMPTIRAFSKARSFTGCVPNENRIINCLVPHLLTLTSIDIYER